LEQGFCRKHRAARDICMSLYMYIFYIRRVGSTEKYFNL